MNHGSHHRATTRSFEEKYLRFGSEPGAALRAASGGLVVNGWTTRPQAGWMASALRLERGDRLLDIGSGRGWPGVLIAEQTGARLVSLDVPFEAHLQGASHADGRLVGRVHRVCGDGRVLPLGDRHFAAVCHADVLC